ncbi:DUF4145 domain-containing protein [Cochlodiniinecator piscidefendens]|uniref:DUF4145 domain-containing protein n=1 Tax=Cochlodiniinecator piscidefendens TaxID=2715756 RepID=UPI00140C8A09|nr:DUF4145 domain-containing protein [Cochlodiniinecator piscidefendens]
MESEFEAGHCHKCGSKHASVVKNHTESFSDSDGFVSISYKILMCGGCGAFYFKSSEVNSEDYAYVYNEDVDDDVLEYNKSNCYWPPALKYAPPHWNFDIWLVDSILSALIDDVYTALNNDLGVLAAIGMRTVFDRASELLKIDPNENFKNKLALLKKAEHVTAKDVKTLGILIDAGSAAAHRGWRPSARQLDAMMTILEAFLQRAFVLNEIGEELEKSVPKKGVKASI